MIRDITLGQYYPGESWIHRLDARVKLVATLLFIVGLFLVDDYPGFICPVLGTILVISMARVPVSYMLRGLTPVFFIIVLTFIINMFMITGKVLVYLGPLTITYEGLQTAVFMALRLILLIVGSSVLTLTTKPVSLTEGMERLLAPLKKIGVPAHELAMMMTIALRFIPTLLDETDKIMKAQMARGADFESGNIFARAKSLIPLLVPLFISAFRIAQDLAMAMESRCYHGDVGRTHMHVMKLAARDYISIAAFIIFFAAIIFEKIYF
ncbi:MAG: energy-coupling factor transporter transmembrane protein EcfT [Clostridia bacterium]|nr:energy-coupling factor transporter transmembrane protein EcfT [Clostridia bacterium]